MFCTTLLLPLKNFLLNLGFSQSLKKFMQLCTVAFLHHRAD